AGVNHPAHGCLMSRLEDVRCAYAIYASAQFRILLTDIRQNCREVDDDIRLVSLQRSEDSLAVCDIAFDRRACALVPRLNHVVTYGLLASLTSKVDELLREET